MTLFEPHFGPDVPMWNFMPHFFGYIERTSRFLAQGRPGAEIVVLMNSRAFWAGKSSCSTSSTTKAVSSARLRFTSEPSEGIGRLDAIREKGDSPAMTAFRPFRRLAPLGVLFVLAVGAPRASAQMAIPSADGLRDNTPVPATELDFYDQYLAYRLSFGIAYVHAAMSDKSGALSTSDEGTRTFLGHINRLSDDEMGGAAFLARYECTRNLAVELGFNPEITLGTWNDNLAGSDGSFSFRTLYAALLVEYPIEEYCLAPYAGFGLVRTSASMSTAEWWRRGYISPSAWRHRGERSAVSREMSIDAPSIGFLLTLGITADLWRHISADLFYRYFATGDADADVYCHYTNGGTLHSATGKFPTDHSLFGAALRLVF